MLQIGEALLDGSLQLDAVEQIVERAQRVRERVQIACEAQEDHVE